MAATNSSALHRLRNLHHVYRDEWVDFCHRRSDGKKALLDYPPRWVTIGITGNCAFQCEFCASHCPASGEDPVTAHQYKMSFNLSRADFERAVRSCHDAGVPRVHICGTGEPFLHPEILELIDFAASVYGRVSVQSDFIAAVFEKKDFVAEIIKRGDRISTITTDIFPAAVHEAIKKGSDFDYLVDCMARISAATGITFDAHVLLTKQTYEGLTELLQLLDRRGVRTYLNVVNLFPLGFNEFTSIDNVYRVADVEITAELDRLRQEAARLGVPMSLPLPWEQANAARAPCDVFWLKAQLMPSKKLPKARWPGNAIPQQCPAVVNGGIFSMGNLFDHEDFFSFWNNRKWVEVRRRILRGELPDPACRGCYIGTHGGFTVMSRRERLAQLLPSRLAFIGHRIPLRRIPELTLKTLRR